MYSCFVVNISRKSLLVDTCITHTDYKYASKFLFLLFLLFSFRFLNHQKQSVNSIKYARGVLVVKKKSDKKTHRTDIYFFSALFFYITL
jgi:hypothetical protein